MNKLKSFIFYAIIWGAVLLMGGIVLISSFKSGPNALKLPFYTGILFIALAILFIFLCLKIKLLDKISPVLILILIIIISLIPRLLWVHFIETQPYSDFLHLYNYGINASHGDFKGFADFYSVFPFKMSFGLVLAGLFSVFGPTLLVAKLFNVIMSVALVIIVFYGARSIYGHKAAAVSGLLLAMWPADIMYTSVIASEHLFLVLFTAAAVLMLKFLNKYTYKNYALTNGNLLLLSIGSLTALAQLIRPMAILLLPVFFVYVLFFKRYRARITGSLGLKLKSVLLVVISYVVVINLINLPVERATGVDVTRSDSGFNLLVGTNYQAKGMFNYKDFGIIEKYDYDIDKVHSEAKKIAMERITSQPLELPSLFLKKIEILWGNENYGYYWSTSPMGETRIESLVKSHPRVFYGLSQTFYVTIVLLAICSCLYHLREKRYDALIILMIFGGIFLSYLLLEVQSRYHLPVIPLLIMFGCGFMSGTHKYGE